MKKYIIKNKRPLLLAILFSIIASIFAVKVQFIKGSLLDMLSPENLILV